MSFDVQEECEPASHANDVSQYAVKIVFDVIAGHVPMAMASVHVAKSLVEDRRIKALGVTGPARSPALPAVPTLTEAGMKPAEVELGFWFGVFGPKGMPKSFTIMRGSAACPPQRNLVE